MGSVWVIVVRNSHHHHFHQHLHCDAFNTTQGLSVRRWLKVTIYRYRRSFLLRMAPQLLPVLFSCLWFCFFLLMESMGDLRLYTGLKFSSCCKKYDAVHIKVWRVYDSHYELPRKNNSGCQTSLKIAQKEATGLGLNLWWLGDS